MFRKLKLNKILVLFFVTFVFSLKGVVFASSEPLNVCQFSTPQQYNYPNHMAASCNQNSLSFNIPVTPKISGNTVSVSQTETFAFDVNITSFPLLGYLDSLNSNGTPISSSNGNPFSSFVSSVQKLNYNNYINFSKLNSSLPGLGSLNMPVAQAISFGNISVQSNPQSQVGNNAFFSVPGLGMEADLFTLGSMFMIDNNYNPQNLPNASVLSSNTQNNYNTAPSSSDINSNCTASTVKDLTCKLLNSYGNPTQSTQPANSTLSGYYNVNGGYSSLTTFFSSVINFLQGLPLIGSWFGTQAITTNSTGFCPNLISNFNMTNSFTQANLNQSSPFTIKVQQSCNLSNVNCTLASETTVPVQINTNLYLQGLNRALADEWYAEASLDQGPPIGHTGAKGVQYINHKTGFLHTAVLQCLETSCTNSPYGNSTTISNNLFSGIGIEVSANIKVVQASPTNAQACLAQDTSSSASLGSSNQNFAFPWVGAIPVIQQHLASENFQPYFTANPFSGNNLPVLPQGEYYIKNRSSFPDPLVLYLIYSGALSKNDPIVKNAIGSYYSSNSSTTSTSFGSYTGPFDQVACLKVLNATPPSTPNYSSSKIINDASAFLGGQYSENPSTPSCVPFDNSSPLPSPNYGIDCSGLAKVVYAASGFLIPRTTFEQFQSPALKIFYNPTKVVPGDLVFYYVRQDGPGVQHVAIVSSWSGINNYSTIEAAKPSKGVTTFPKNSFSTCYAPQSEAYTYTPPNGNGYCIAGFGRPSSGNFNGN